MPLNSTSTDAQVWAAYDDNATYQEDASVAKCKAFVTACIILLRRNPRRTGTREADIELNADGIRDELANARQWLAANENIYTGTKRLNFNDFGQ
jgi:hypothetical protein